MKRTILFLILTVSAFSQFGQLTNQSVQNMVRAGIPADVIAQAIKTAQMIAYSVNQQEYDQLMRACIG